MKRSRTSVCLSIHSLSFRQHDWLVVTLATQSAKYILLEATLGVEGGFWIEVWVRRPHFAPPLLITLFHRRAERFGVRGVGEFEIRKTGQGLQRFPGIEADGGIRIEQAVNQIRIEPV